MKISSTAKFYRVPSPNHAPKDLYLPFIDFINSNDRLKESYPHGEIYQVIFSFSDSNPDLNVLDYIYCDFNDNFDGVLSSVKRIIFRKNANHFYEDISLFYSYLRSFKINSILSPPHIMKIVFATNVAYSHNNIGRPLTSEDNFLVSTMINTIASKVGSSLGYILVEDVYITDAWLNIFGKTKNSSDVEIFIDKNGSYLQIKLSRKDSTFNRKDFFDYLYALQREEKILSILS